MKSPFDDVLAALRKEETHYVFDASALTTAMNRARAIEQGEQLFALIGECLRFAQFLASERKSPVASATLLDEASALVERLTQLADRDAGAEMRAMTLAGEIKRARPVETGAPTPAQEKALRAVARAWKRAAPHAVVTALLEMSDHPALKKVALEELRKAAVAVATLVQRVPAAAREVTEKFCTSLNEREQEELVVALVQIGPDGTEALAALLFEATARGAKARVKALTTAALRAGASETTLIAACDHALVREALQA